MINYRGVSLESIAPVKIEDIRISPVQLNATNRPRPISPGSDFVRIHSGTRTVSIMFALLTMDMNTRQRQLMDINKWALSYEEAPLTLPNYQNMHLNCICTATPEPSTRQWWESKLRLVFTAYDDPFWVSNWEKSVSCGTEFFVGGDAPPLMQIRHTFSSSASNVSYSDGSRTMTFSTIPAGNMVIDLNRQTAAVGSTNIMQYYSFSSRFPKPETGTHTITGTGTIYYRERWV